MKLLTNKSNLPLSVSVFLASDDYSFKPASNRLSATDLNKSTRELVLREQLRAANLDVVEDVLDRYNSRLGTAVHDAIEKVWTTPNKLQTALRQLDSEHYYDRIVVNPSPEELTKEVIPVYLEKRVNKEFHGFTISGQFDFIINGQLEDFKTTTTFNFTKGKSKDSYILQGSIYRWLNQDIVRKNTVLINYIIKDWSKAKAERDVTYPQAPIVAVHYPLMSVQDTEAYILKKIEEFKSLRDSDQSKLPLCSAEDLWQDPPTYKYYSTIGAKRCAPKGDYGLDAGAAYARMAKEGRGEVKVIQSKVKKCSYCSAAPICKQREELELIGLFTP